MQQFRASKSRVTNTGSVSRARPRLVFPQRPKRKFPRGLRCMHTGAGGEGGRLGGGMFRRTDERPARVPLSHGRSAAWCRPGPSFVSISVCVRARRSGGPLPTCPLQHRGDDASWGLAPHPARRQSCCAARGVVLAWVCPKVRSGAINPRCSLSPPGCWLCCLLTQNPYQTLVGFCGAYLWTPSSPLLPIPS
jgi:hypothetical protein